jgi:hypothetical protein
MSATITSPVRTDMRRPARSVRLKCFIDYCEICDAQELFVVGGLGLLARCMGCGDERVILYSRMNSEAA